MRSHWIGRLRRRVRKLWRRFLRFFQRLHKAESERLFESYLREASLGWAYEQLAGDSERRPDYRVVLEGHPTRFEVKQFEQDPKEEIPKGAFTYDPYPPLRKKIGEAAKQLHALKGKEACCVVLFNKDRLLIDLSPMMVFGAMLGDLGFTFPVDTRTGVGDIERGRTAFGERGKMIRYKSEKAWAAQNTTISAVVVLSLLNMGQRWFQVQIRNEERALGRQYSLEEVLERMEQAAGTESDVSRSALRIVVCENPYAALRLGSFAVGPYDERYGPNEAGELVRLFVGDELKKLEAAERDIESNDE